MENPLPLPRALPLSLPLRLCLHLVYVYLSLSLYLNIYYQHVAHMITEVEKSQDLQLAHWRPRRANGIVSVQVRSQEGTNISAQSSLAGGISSYLWDGQLFCSIQALYSPDKAHPHTGKQPTILSL